MRAAARVRQATSSLRRRLRSTSPPVLPTDRGPAVSGLVEEFSRRTGGRLGLRAGGRRSHARRPVREQPQAHVDLRHSGRRHVRHQQRPAPGEQPEIAPEDRGDARVHHWQASPMAGPADDRRNSNQQIRTFSFTVRGLWPYVRRGTKITVQVDGKPLPIHRPRHVPLPAHAREAHRAGAAREAQAGLRASRSTAGCSSPSSSTREWQQGVIDLYTRVRAALREELGYDVWFVYGTLLGAVREGDLHRPRHRLRRGVRLSRCRTGPEAAAELADIALALIARGFDVDCHVTALHISDSEVPDRPLPHLLRRARRAALPLRDSGHQHRDPGRLGRHAGDRLPRRHGPGPRQRRADGRLPLR